MPFVLDASVALGWSFRDEENAYAHRVLTRLDGDGGLVPSIWVFEVTNGFLIAERRGRVTEADVVQMCADLASLPIEPAGLSFDQVLGPVIDLARAHRLTAYDASYLDLALHEGLPLATQDESLRAAAERLGVALVE